MLLEQALNIIKKHRDKIDSIKLRDEWDSDDFDYIIKNNGKCEIYVGDIVYKNGITIAVEVSLDTDVSYSTNKDELEWNLMGIIDHKSSFLNAVLKDDMSLLMDGVTYQDVLDEEEATRIAIEKYGDLYGLK